MNEPTPHRTVRMWDAIFGYSRKSQLRVVTGALAMIGVIGLLDLLVLPGTSLGFLYVIPLIVAAGFLKRWQVLLLALACALMREVGSLAPLHDDYLARMVLVSAAFGGAALFVKELVRNQRVTLERVEDLKARQQLERKLLRAQRLEAIGRLAGGIAHDFNNLLSVIIGFSDLALAQLEPDSAVRADMDQVRRAADRAAVLTRQLLGFSRRDMIQPRVTDLNSLVSSLTSMLRRLIGEDIELRMELPSGLSRVVTDAGSMEQVIMNLVVNARDAMPDGGTLTIQTAEAEVTPESAGAPPGIAPGKYVMLIVRDTGVGMDRKIQEHVFEPFYTTKEVGKGTGLGLSTVYGIVKQSAGDIWFVSEPGRGTTFTIYLPPTDALPAKVEPRPRVPERKLPATILLVEDDDAVRQLATEILTRNGIKVIAASGPAEALAIGKRPSFHLDLLLTDVVMPRMSGPDLARKFRKERPNLNVLFMTGYASPSVLQDAGEQANTSLVRKPLSEASLMQSVRAALGAGCRAARSCAH